MHFITTLKSSGEIIDYRVDNSIPPYWANDTLKAAVSLSRNIAQNKLETYIFADLPEIDVDVSIDALTPHIHAYDTTTGKLKNNAEYVAPAIEKKFSIDDVISQLTLTEKNKFINRSTPTVVTAINELRTLKNKKDTTEILQFLVDSQDISQTSMTKILG